MASSGVRTRAAALALVLLAACGAPLETLDGSEPEPDDAASVEDAAPAVDDAALEAPDAALEPDAEGADVPPSGPDAAVFDAVTARDVGPALDAAGPDGARDAGLPDATPDATPDAGAPPASGVAPATALPDAVPGRDGANPVRLAAGAEALFRVDAARGEHLAFRLDFTPTRAAVVLRLHRWDGAAVQTLGETDAGAGLRVLAALDPDAPRTFWVRVLAAAAVEGALRVTRTPFSEGSRCASDCARLLQLPLRNDPRVDGYDHTRGTVLRYQFGRRDLLMFFRYAARSMARDGYAPLIPEDFSQWNGETPGVDVGAPRHASHQRGKDVDVSLHGLDGQAPWRSYCTAVRGSDGRECQPGTVRNYDGVANALAFLRYFESRRVTMCFLDRELIPPTVAGAMTLSARGLVPADLLRWYSDGRHLQHWPNHDNHIHVRVSEAEQSMQIDDGAMLVEPFEAP